MDDFPHLDHAPITEALLDLKVALPTGVGRDEIELVMPESFGYYKKGPILRGSFGFQLSAEGNEALARSLPGTSAVIGVRLHSRDEKHVAQFTTEGFTLSRLEPYDSWEALVREAQRVWPIYVGLVKPVNVRRVAARYINKLRLPYERGDDFDRFITLMPNFAPDLPQGVSSFLQRFEFQDPTCDAVVNLTIALNPGTQGQEVPIILDIDAFRYHVYEPTDGRIWDDFPKLRSLKNRFFFRSVTAATIELYK